MDQARSQVQVESAAVDGTGVRVAVLDTGICEEHPDFEHCRDGDRCRSFTLSNSVNDRYGHGTHIAGIIAGSGDVSEGRFRGIAPGVELWVARISEGAGFYEMQAVEAVQWALENGADIINYSASSKTYAAAGRPPWKWSDQPSDLEAAMIEATSGGVLCVAAAGNLGPEVGTVEAPGIRREILSVGALNREGVVADGSARGPVRIDGTLGRGRVRRLEGAPGEQFSFLNKPDLVLPGGDLDSVWTDHDTYGAQLMECLGITPGGIIAPRAQSCSFPAVALHGPSSKYVAIAGTSQATGIASGLAALALQYARDHNLNFGRKAGVALATILKAAAVPPRGGPGGWDCGDGEPIWPRVRDELEECMKSESRREFVMGGGQLRLE